MNIIPRFKLSALRALFLLAGAAAPIGLYADVATDPCGFVSVNIPANSDFHFTVPLVQPPQFVGTIQSASGNTIFVNQLNGLPNWTPNSLVYVQGTQSTTYYALMASGTKEGMHCPITANGTNSLTIDPGTDSLTGVVTGTNGDSIKVVPYWTLSTLFTNFASPSLPDQTQAMIFDGVQGINTSAAVVYTYYAGYGWYNGGTPANDVCISPGQSMVIRNVSGSAFQLNVTANVPVNKHYAMLSTTVANQPQDNPIGYLSPTPSTLGQVGLGISDQDQLLVFDNTASGYNKSATQVITYYLGYGWYEGGAEVDSTFQLQPGYSYILRKAATATPASVLWQNEQPYLPLQ